MSNRNAPFTDNLFQCCVKGVWIGVESLTKITLQIIDKNEKNLK